MNDDRRFAGLRLGPPRTATLALAMRSANRKLGHFVVVLATKVRQPILLRP
jgi:hypothetical protein